MEIQRTEKDTALIFAQSQLERLHIPNAIDLAKLIGEISHVPANNETPEEDPARDQIVAYLTALETIDIAAVEAETSTTGGRQERISVYLLKVYMYKMTGRTTLFEEEMNDLLYNLSYMFPDQENDIYAELVAMGILTEEEVAARRGK